MGQPAPAGDSDRVFQDRRDAGRALARLLDQHRGTPGLLVLALPRSGAPVDPGDCRLVGFTTYAGTVTAADDWAGPAERKAVRPALPGSVEELFHSVGAGEFMVRPGRADVLRSSRLERAIGVVYRPATERDSHYFRARVGDQFDAVIHVDETRGWSRSSGPRAGRPGSSRRPIHSPC